MEKREPKFIDDYLLGRDLKPYLRPYAWGRLNAAEKALLGQALPEAKNRVLTDLQHRWEYEAPSPDVETQLFTQTLRGTDLAIREVLGLELSAPMSLGSDGASYLMQKLRSIIVPVVDFEDTTVEEATDFLRGRSMELDTLELDPARKGVNFVIRQPRGSGRPVSDPGSARHLGGDACPGPRGADRSTTAQIDAPIEPTRIDLAPDAAFSATFRTE